eukprot:PhM_4_TR5164/c0_g1_i1/m.79835/K17914/KIF13; kinesin family member 13
MQKKTARDSSRVQVAVRVRPLNRADGTDTRLVVRTNSSDAAVHAEFDTKGKKSYYFDHAFSNTQEEVFDAIGRPMLDEAFKGFNVCLFAYGQTGSGKTYSIQGDMGGARGLSADSGILPRLAHEIFRTAEERMNLDTTLEVSVKLSYLEIYMERVRDLLVERTRGVDPENLEIHEDLNHKVYVKDLKAPRVHNLEKVWQLVRLGNAQRQTAETKMNEFSSRSHSILQFTICQTYDSPSVEKPNVESTISLVDLAGSERQSKTEASGLQLDEAKKINLSLTTLGRVLRVFSEGKVGDTDQFLPLRESKLTRLLSESFGGNSKTWMLATVSPTAYNQLETMSTLDYANMAKSIMNRAVVNKLKQQLELKEMKEQCARTEQLYFEQRARAEGLEESLAAAQRSADEYKAEAERLKKELEALREENTALKTARSNSNNNNNGGASTQLPGETPRRMFNEHFHANIDPASGVTPRTARHESSSLFVARATVTLKSVLEQRASFYTLPLMGPAGTSAALQVKIYPVDANGVGTETPRAILPNTLLGQRLDFVVHVMCAQDIPKAFSSIVYCKYVFKWAEKDPYKSRDVANSTCPQFDFKKRFAFSKMNEQLMNYFRSDDVITFEVFGVAAK